jgi:hypothetical protein
MDWIGIQPYTKLGLRVDFIFRLWVHLKFKNTRNLEKNQKEKNLDRKKVSIMVVHDT